MVKNTTYLHRQTLSQSLEMCSANQPYTLQYFCAKLNADRTTQKKFVPATINAPYSLDFCAVINAVRTAINAARTVNKNLDFSEGKCLETRAEVNAAVQQQRPYSTSVPMPVKTIRTALNEVRTLPRFLCKLLVTVSIFFFRKTRALLKLSTSSLSSLFSSCKKVKSEKSICLPQPFCLT